MEKRFSYVWNFFAVSDAASFKAVCYICNHTLSYRTTTTNLKKHLLTRHPEIQLKPNSVVIQDDISDLLSETSDAKIVPADKDENAKVSEKRPSEASNDSSIVKLKKIDQDYTLPRKMNSQLKKQIDNNFLNLFTKDLHTFSLVEDSGFQAFVDALNAQYEIPDLKTISETLLPEIYEKLKHRVEDVLRDGLAITLAIEAWTSIHNEYFIGIKANFLDQSFNVMSVFLDCYSFSEQPTNEKLNDLLKNVIAEWGINQKITLVVTNSIYETTAEDQLQWDTINCVIYSINIIVLSSLDIISALLLKVQSVVSCYKQNKFATSELMRNQAILGVVAKDLILSNSTDWYSVFSMLKRFVELEDFVKITLGHLDVNRTFLTKEEWDVCREVVEIIKPFETFMKSLSEEKYITSPLAIILSKGLETVLKDLSVKPFHSISQAVLSKCIEETFEQFNYLYSSSNILLISTFLDPRFKDVIFESNVKESLKQSIISIISTSMTQSKEQDTSKPEEASVDEDTQSIWKAFQSRASLSRPSNKKNSRACIEIQQYLEDGLLPRNENPMQWWKINGHMYPQLKNLMKENLAVTCTAVSCENFFSKSSQILKERRSRLAVEEAKLILFINNNQYLMKINDLL